MAVTYSLLFSRLGKLFGMARTVREHQANLRNRFSEIMSAYVHDPYSTGTVAISSGVVTLSGGTFPSWAARGIFRVNGLTYTVDSRDSNTQITLDDTSVAASSSTAYEITATSDAVMLGNLTKNLETEIDESLSLMKDIQADAESTLVEMVDADLVASHGGGLSAKTTQEALKELVRQMKTASSSVDGSTITIGTVAAGSANSGNGTLVVSGLASQENAPDVVNYSSIKTELLRATCDKDSADSAIVENAERFLVEGQRQEVHLDEDWPKGSGLKVRVNSVNPAVDGGSTPGVNVLTNSDFEAFSVANTPDSWTIATGSAGTHVLSTASSYFGGTALDLNGNGSTAIKLTQAFNISSGTVGSIKPDTPYTLSFAVKRVGSPSAGVLKIYATDGSAVLNNSDSNRKMEVSLEYNNVLLTTSYVLISVAVMTPKIIPKGSYMVIETSTPFTAGVDIYIDHLSLAEMHRITPGGVAFQIVPGATKFAYGDFFTSQVTNNREGDFETEFDRFFNMSSLGYGLPSHYGGSETISDALIT
jgi:hypothetical protein